jgi:TP901 family phage tail tape measure protein
VNGVVYNIQIKGGAEIAVDRIMQKMNGLNKLSGRINQVSLQSFIGNVQNVAGSFAAITQPSLNFGKTISELSAITGIAGADLDDLAETSRKVGKDSGLGASQAAEAFKLLASNIDVAKIGINGLKTLQKETIALSQAAGTDLPLAADTMAASINQFGLNASDASRVINALAAGAKYGAAEIPDLAMSLKVAGTTASQAGLQIEDTVGALEVLSQNALKGSEAGTGLRNVLIALQTKAIPGVDLKTQGLSGALAMLKPHLSDTTFLAKTFGRENINAAQVLIKNADSVKEMTDKVTGSNVAYEQAAINTDNWAHKIEVIKAKVDDFKIGLVQSTGSIFPWMTVLSETLIPIAQMAPLLQMLTKVTWLFNASLWANPITWIVIGIAALIAGVILLIIHFDKVSAWIIKIWNNIKAFFANIWNKIKDSFNKLWDWVSNLFQNNKWLAIFMPIIGIPILIKKNWSKIVDWFKTFTAWIKQHFGGLIEFFKDLFRAIWAAFKTIYIDPFLQIWDWIKDSLGIKGKKEIPVTILPDMVPMMEALDKMNDEQKQNFVDEYNRRTGQNITLDDFKKVRADQIASNKAGNIEGISGNDSIISDGLSSVSGAASGNDVRNNNIRIENLVKEIKIHVNQFNESTGEIKAAISRALIDAVRDTEIAIS